MVMDRRSTKAHAQHTTDGTLTIEESDTKCMAPTGIVRDHMDRWSTKVHAQQTQLSIEESDTTCTPKYYGANWHSNKRRGTKNMAPKSYRGAWHEELGAECMACGHDHP